MMRAAYLAEPGRFDLRDVPLPKVGPRDALIKIERCGICGTDIHIFHGNYAADKLPLIPGHEFTGTVAGFGSEVTNLTEGQACVVDMNIGCGLCFFCRRNEILNCPEMQQMGITIDGAFAEYISVPARLVIPAEGMAGEVRALTEPLSCVVRSARKAGITFGQSVVVLGAGPIGNLHVQLLRTIGAAPIIVAELSEDRAAMAKASGADVVVTDPAKLHKTVMAWTDGRGADVVIESVGVEALYKAGQSVLRRGGHLVAFGLTPPGGTLSFEITDTILREDSMGSSVAGQGPDMHDALTLLRHDRINTTPFTGADYALDQIQEAFDSFADRPSDLKTQIVM